METWADANRVLPPGTAIPGPWRTSITPYLRGPMAAVTDPRIRTIVFVSGSQMGKTEFQLNTIGYTMDVDASPMLFFSASQDLAESVASSRLMPMLRSVPSLWDKLDKRKTHSKVCEKFIGGQRLGFATSGSAIALSSHPVRVALVDELDLMAVIPGMGSVMGLARARLATYPDSKLIVCSTPSVDGASPIVTEWEHGTAARWEWPCPECSAFFVAAYNLLEWGGKCTSAEAKKRARLRCPHCAALIEDKHRTAMNAKGRWTITGDAESECASFWVSGLCSPFVSFGDSAQQWLEAYASGEHESMRAVINTRFGELFKSPGDAPAAEAVKALRYGYKTGDLPAGVRGITCGVDVQKSSLYFAVIGWGYGSEAWLLREGQLFGETDQLPVWSDLVDLLEMFWGDARLAVRGMLVDSGYRPDAVYNFCLRYPGRCLASKGHDTLPVPVKQSDAEPKRGIKLMHIHTFYFKDFVHTRLRTPLGERGAFNLPIDCTDDFCEQLVAESKLTKPNGSVVWIHNRNIPNHYFDATVLASAAAYMLNLLNVPKPAAKPEPVEGEMDKAAPPPPPPTVRPWAQSPFPTRGPGPQLGGGNWTTNWGRQRR